MLHLVCYSPDIKINLNRKFILKNAKKDHDIYELHSESEGLKFDEIIVFLLVLLEAISYVTLHFSPKHLFYLKSGFIREFSYKEL